MRDPSERDEFLRDARRALAPGSAATDQLVESLMTEMRSQDEEGRLAILGSTGVEFGPNVGWCALYAQFLR